MMVMAHPLDPLGRSALEPNGGTKETTTLSLSTYVPVFMQAPNPQFFTAPPYNIGINIGMKVSKPGTVDEPGVQVGVDAAIQAVKDKIQFKKQLKKI